MIPIPAFEPDRSRFNPLSTGDLKNAIPAPDGWRPLPSLEAISDALGSACLGAITVRQSDGTYVLIAGTETGLYRLDTSDFSWEDISGADAPFSVPSGDRWTFTVYGERLIAHNIGDDVQVYDIEAGTDFAPLGGTPPRAKYSVVAGEFLVLMHLEGEADTIQWSGLGDIEEWVPGEKGSDKQRLPSGGEVVGGIGDERGALVIQRTAMRYMQFAPGSGYTFTIAPANEERGAIAPLSIVQIGPGDFLYLSEDGFYRGVAGQPIGGDKVDRWFFDSIARENIPDVRGVADPFEKIVWWAFIDVTGQTYLLGYHWQLNRWCYADNNVEELVAMATPAITIDGLDTLYATIDDASVPFDSRLLQGGALTFAAFDRDHKLAYFTGANQAVEASTGEMQINPAGRFMMNGARIVTDATAATLTVGASDYHGGATAWRGPVSMSSRTKFVGVRSDARLHQFKIDIPAGAEWSILSGLDVQGAASGA